jgi:hypothetical protein
LSRNWRDADDPARVLERKQNRSCKNCAHVRREEYLGRIKWLCRKAVQPAKPDVLDMERCKKFVPMQ